MSSEWTVTDGMVCLRGKVYLSSSSPLISTIISGIHDMAHEGVQKTLHRVRNDFYWKGMKKHVADYVQGCHVCQRNKSKNLQPADLLQPLPIPQQIWSHISMDFIEGLPKVHGKSVCWWWWIAFPSMLISCL